MQYDVMMLKRNDPDAKIRGLGNIRVLLKKNFDSHFCNCPVVWSINSKPPMKGVQNYLI